MSFWRHTASGKTAVFAVFALQLLLAGAVPYADSRLEAQAAGTSVHVETETGRDCGAAHDHALCQLCRTLHLGRIPVAGTSAGPDAGPVEPVSFPTSTSGEVRTPLCLPLGSRAPPPAL